MADHSPSIASMVLSLGVRAASRTARHAMKESYLQSHPWYATNAVCEDRCVFIGGCGRSGTTLLREILNRHSAFAIGPESTFLCDLLNTKRLSVIWEMDRGELERAARSSKSVVRFAEWFFRRHLEVSGKRRWGDKTPRNVLFAPMLLGRFPNSVFVHALRDGRDVACSLRNHPRETVSGGRVVAAKHRRTISYSAARWVRDAGAGVCLQGHPRYVEVRYEDLVGEPEVTVRSLCERLGESYEPAMLAAGSDCNGLSAGLMNNRNASGALSSSSVGRWRHDLAAGERVEFDRIAGELLVAMGYASDSSWVRWRGGNAGLEGEGVG